MQVARQSRPFGVFAFEYGLCGYQLILLLKLPDLLLGQPSFLYIKPVDEEQDSESKQQDDGRECLCIQDVYQIVNICLRLHGRSGAR
jgi:hypothetical protein